MQILCAYARLIQLDTDATRSSNIYNRLDNNRKARPTLAIKENKRSLKLFPAHAKPANQSQLITVFLCYGFVLILI